MGWALAIFSLVVGGVAAMLATMRAIGRATDELQHDRLSVRFWGLLAALGILLAAAFTYPMIANDWAGSEPGRVMVALISLPPAFVTAVGLRNAVILAFAGRRRRAAMAGGARVEGRVVDRSRRLFANDIMSVVVEADLPVTEPATELAYRARDPRRTRVHRFVETCPTDHWARLEPGTGVALRYLPERLDCFAVELFPRAAPSQG